MTKNRPLDPSEMCTLEFKGEFRRSAIFPVSATIGIYPSILGSPTGKAAIRSLVKIPSTHSSAHRFLHERSDLCPCGGGRLLQRVGGRPHVAFVEVRLVAEAKRSIRRLELLSALKKADDIAVLCI